MKAILTLALCLALSGTAWAEPSEVGGYNVERLANAIYKAEGFKLA